MPEKRIRKPGNGYPDDWRRINIWMPEDLKRRLKHASVDVDIDMSTFVRDAIESKLNGRINQ